MQLKYGRRRSEERVVSLELGGSQVVRPLRYSHYCGTARLPVGRAMNPGGLALRLCGRSRGASSGSVGMRVYGRRHAITQFIDECSRAERA